MQSDTIKQQLIVLEQLLVQPATHLLAELLNRYLADDFSPGESVGLPDINNSLFNANTDLIACFAAYYFDWPGQLICDTLDKTAAMAKALMPVAVGNSAITW